MNDMQEFATSIVQQVSYIRDELKSAMDAATLDKPRAHGALPLRQRPEPL